MLGLRLGARPQVVITTTPKPVRLIRELMANPETIVTRGTTYDNRANLSPRFFAQIIRRYEGTRIGPPCACSPLGKQSKVSQPTRL